MNEIFSVYEGFFRRFRDPIRVPRILNRVPRIRESGPYRSKPGS